MSTFDDPNREAVGLEPIWAGAGDEPPTEPPPTEETDLPADDVEPEDDESYDDEPESS